MRELRTGICWADWYASEGDGWYAWLLPRSGAGRQTPAVLSLYAASLGIVPKFSSPPQTPKAYADFIDVMITRFGQLLRLDRVLEPAEQPQRVGLPH